MSLYSVSLEIWDLVRCLEFAPTAINPMKCLTGLLTYSLQLHTSAKLNDGIDYTMHRWLAMSHFIHYPNDIFYS